MKANGKVIENLQKALGLELAAANQYMLHAHVAEDWGLARLAAKMREEMTEELGHADGYMRRLMFLKATPEMKPAKVPVRAQQLVDMLEADLRDEADAISFYAEAAQAAEKVGDLGTRELFLRTLLDEEGHMSWLDNQLGLLKRLGEPSYALTQMAAEPAPAAAPAA